VAQAQPLEGVTDALAAAPPTVPELDAAGLGQAAKAVDVGCIISRL
jgi:hypothetical protein